ncbi:hypothetical protein AB0P15_35050 [Streptomyces sp. NPDC087917]|uniref:hypothetical protein n=1 Tax=Streptomyces sp. NPDC087917 TaxID=3155060 RepID=UPI003417FEE9
MAGERTTRAGGWRWPAAVGVNLLLGVPGVVPAWLLWYFAANWPLKDLGWTVGEPTENDGALPWVIVAAPVLALFALAWGLVNRSLRRGTGLPPGRYWPVCAVATLTPTLALVIASIPSTH